MDIQTSPDGKTTKYARLADIVDTYPGDAGAVLGVSVFRASPKIGLERGRVFDIRFMERHPFTSQAFIPMGKAEVCLRFGFEYDLSGADGCSGKAKVKKR
jgi:allantoicase